MACHLRWTGTVLGCSLLLVFAWPRGAFGLAVGGGDAKPSGSPSLAAALSDEVTPYLEIPIVGRLGMDVVPQAVETCLRHVSQNPRIKHVVFRIKSPGGQLAAAERIVEIMQKYGRSVKYHALVEQANGVAILLAFTCDSIHLASAGTLGGATASLPDSGGGGGPRVDDGTAASLTAKYVAAAAAKGYPEAVVRAMVLPAGDLCAWVGADGKPQVRPQAPKDVPDDQVIFRKAAGTLLVLNRDQAVKVGVAVDGAVDKCPDVGQALGLPGWRGTGDYGINVMKRMQLNRADRLRKAKEDAAGLKEAMEKNTENRHAQAKAINDNLEEANVHEGRAAGALLDPDGGGGADIPADVKRRGRLEAQAAIDAWTNVQKGISCLVWLEKEAAALNQKLDESLADWRAGQPSVPELVALAAEAEKWRLKPLENVVNLSDLLGRAERAIERLKRQKP
jgi:hypothetical protein